MKIKQAKQNRRKIFRVVGMGSRVTFLLLVHSFIYTGVCLFVFVR